MPENVADAVYVLTGPELSRSTGLHIPVDSGVAAVDLGATSGRVMVGHVGPVILHLEQSARFRNDPVALAQT